ncbi:MAG: hypothetical protein ACE5JR_01935 [Gemmatimonadota bacterium]
MSAFACWPGGWTPLTERRPPGPPGPWPSVGPAAARVTVALLLFGAAPLRAQDPTPPPRPVPTDSLRLRRDSARALPKTPHAEADSLGIERELRRAGADSLGVAGDSARAAALAALAGARQDTAPERRQAYPAPLELPGDGYAAAVYEWDLSEQLRTGALSLLDLLVNGLPGFTSVRASYYGGPHHLLDGLLGAGFVRVLVDGRELDPLEGGQIDLTRISLVRLERVRALRHADGWTIELSTLRHDRPDAYSRITAGTGEPGLELLRGTFTNGLGRDFTIATAIDLLNVTSGDLQSDRFDFWGKLSWIPTDNRAGIELQWKSESLERTVLENEDVDRRELFLYARGDITRGIQGALFAGSSELRADDEALAESRHAGFSLVGRHERGYARLGLEVRDAAFLPSVSGRASLGAALAPGLTVDLAARADSWRVFGTSGVRGGVRWAPGFGVALVLSGEAATGTRGVPLPQTGTADSVSYDVIEGAAEIAVGPFRLTERIGYQKLGGRLSLGTAFDPPGSLPGSTELQTFETAGSGPILPLGSILRGLEPIRLRGVWRYGRVLSGEFPPFLPQNIVRGEIFFHDEFFDGNLELRLGLALHRRTEWSAPLASDPQSGLVVVPGYTMFDWNLLIRIGTVRIWWRVENLSSVQAEDIPGLAFPINRNAFGVKWEFFN